MARRLRVKRTKGSHHYATTPSGQQQPIGVGTVTLYDDAGDPIGLKALALIGADRVSFYELQQQLSDLPCVVAQLADGATLVYLAKGYEHRLSKSEPFLAGFALGMYQAYEHLADVAQEGGRGQ